MPRFSDYGLLMYVVITIDTECDNAWARSSSVTTENAKYLPRFQEFCEEFGFKPTYLTAYEMAADEHFVRMGREALARNACEIGLHPHPWNSPPIYPLTEDDMRLHPYMIEYPRDVIVQKTTYLTRMLEDTFGVAIRSHRAGKWVFNEVYADVLCELEYRVDCSVTPLVRWATGVAKGSGEKVQIPDYRTFPAEPYFLDERDISQAGSSEMLELPMTIIPRYGAIRSGVYRSVISEWIRRLLRGVWGQPVLWFRPTRGNRRDMLRVARRKLESNAPYLMFMLHSSEFMPGGSPMFRNEEEIEALYRDMRVVFAWLREHGVSGVTCAEYYRIHRRAAQNACENG